MKACGIGRLAVLATLTAVAVGVPLPSSGRMPSDLKLQETEETKVIVTPRPNPHDKLECSVCHLETVPDKRPGPLRVTEEFLDDSFPDSACYDCHETWSELHPSRVDPAKSRMKVSIPSNTMPLRFIHEGWYTVVCMTCHDIHFPHDGFKLLRGFSLSPSTRPSRFADRAAFCQSCHGDQFEYLTPHRVRDRQTGCTLCHVRKPSQGRPQALRTNVNALCTYCHPIYPEPHYLRFNPFPELDQEAIWKSGVPLRDGAYTCVTCHQPHGPTPHPYYLREEFVRLTRVSVRIDPHEKGLFCQNCHADPLLSRGNPKRPTALLEKDVNLLCTRCHAAGKVKIMEHYRGPLTERVKTPGDLPLKDGRITCVTCHLPGCGPTTAENPNFLRGAPASIKDFCARCHEWGGLAARNTHAEYRDDRGCDVCHQSDLAPEGDPAVMPGLLKADQNFVCLPCHDDFPHPSSHRHTVKPAQADYVNVDTATFPLDRHRRVTCYSCHQVMRKSPERSFLRGKEPGCQYCHPY